MGSVQQPSKKLGSNFTLKAIQLCLQPNSRCYPAAVGLQEGYIDAAGNYIQLQRPDEEDDAWLESIEGREGGSL